MANINKIKLSGTTYNIQDLSAAKTVELTQAQYDALVSGGTVDPNTFYVITDAQGADLSNYYTKSETSGATQISTALASKQTTLTAGTGIDITDNVISATGGGGGGKAVSGGTNISITTGETADTINCTLPISASTNGYGIILVTSSTANAGAIASGYKANAAQMSIDFGYSSYTNTTDSIGVGQYNKIEGNGSSKFALGDNNIISNYGKGALGSHLISNAMDEVSCGQYNISRGNSYNFGNSGDTVFTVGNGNFSTRHNAIEIRQNGDIYIADTNDTTYQNFYEKPMIKLQDALGGGGSTYTAGDGIDITNDVISVTGKVDTSAITTSISSSSTDAQVPSAKAVYDTIGNINTILESI